MVGSTISDPAFVDRLGDHGVRHQSQHGAASYGLGKHGDKRERAADQPVADGSRQRCRPRELDQKAEDRPGQR